MISLGKMSFRFSFVLFLSSLAVLPCHFQTINERISKIDEQIDHLRMNFIEFNYKFLWQAQELGDQMIEQGKPEGYVIKKITSLFTSVLATTYAISHKTFNVSKQVLRNYLELAAENRSFAQLTIDDAEVLELQVSFRGLISAIYFNDEKWKLLHKLIYHYVIRGKTTPQLRELAYLVYLGREDTISSAADIKEKIDKDIAKRRGLLNADVKQAFIEELDKVIDRASLGMVNSDGLRQLHEETIEFRRQLMSAKLLFKTEKDVERLIEEIVEPKLLEEIRKGEELTRGNVVQFSREELEKVTSKDINNGKILLPPSNDYVRYRY